MWKDDTQSAPQQDAITVETTAYALLTAVAHRDALWAHSASCWLVEQENYGGGFMSTQVTGVLHGKQTELMFIASVRLQVIYKYNYELYSSTTTSFIQVQQ